MTVVVMVLAFLLMLAGLVGAVIPNFPDTLLILAGAVLLALRDGFTLADGILLGVLALVAIAIEALGYLANTLGAKKAGASWRGVVGAFVGGLIGLFVLQPFGIFIFPLVGALLGELWAGRKGKAAVKAGVGALLGVLGGLALKVAASVTMVGLALLSLLF